MHDLCMRARAVKTTLKHLLGSASNENFKKLFPAVFCSHSSSLSLSPLSSYENSLEILLGSLLQLYSVRYIPERVPWSGINHSRIWNKNGIRLTDVRARLVPYKKRNRQFETKHGMPLTQLHVELIIEQLSNFFNLTSSSSSCFHKCKFPTWLRRPRLPGYGKCAMRWKIITIYCHIKCSLSHHTRYARFISSISSSRDDDKVQRTRARENIFLLVIFHVNTFLFALAFISCFHEIG